MAAPPRRSPEDEALVALEGDPFTPLKMFVCTFEANLSNIRRPPDAELLALLEPRGAIKALNSNFGHKCQPGYERFIKHPRPARVVVAGGAAAGAAARAAGGLAPANIQPRTPQGDATCFNSALEITIIPEPDADMPREVRDLLAARPDKHYAVKSFTSTGSTQVPGVICPGLEDGFYVSRLWAEYLTASGVGQDAAAPVEVVATQEIMINFKFELRKKHTRVILDLAAIADHLERVKDLQDAGTLGPDLAPPRPLREIKHVEDDPKISFKFLEASGKTTRVNIFFRGKVNFLGAGNFETPTAVYAYLSDLFRRHWNDFVVIRPLPDRAARPPAPAVAPAPRSPRSPRSVAAFAIPPALAIADDELDKLLDEEPLKFPPPCSPGVLEAPTEQGGAARAQPPGAGAPEINLDDILTLAADFAADSDDSGVD